MTHEEEKLYEIVRVWNQAVAEQLLSRFDARDVKQNKLQACNTELTTTLTQLLVEAKNLYDHRPAATLDRINRCLRVLSTTT